MLLKSNRLACQEITHNIASRDVVDLYTASLMDIIYMEYYHTPSHYNSGNILFVSVTGAIWEGGYCSCKWRFTCEI